jgi:GH18 family chitinase
MQVVAYYPQWSEGNLGSTVLTCPPSGIDWSGISHVVHFFGKDNVDSTTSPYWTPISSTADAIDYVYNGISNPGGGSATWVNWQAQLINSAHAKGARVYLDIHAVNALELNAMATGSTANIKVMADACVNYGNSAGYDGIQVDWEPFPYPIAPATATSQLFRIFRDSLCSSTGVCKYFMLSPATYAWEAACSITAFDLICPQLYGFTPAWDEVQAANCSWYNSALKRGNSVSAWPNTFEASSWTEWGIAATKSLLQKFIDNGYDKKQLYPGTPTFSYNMKGVSALDKPVTNANLGYGNNLWRDVYPLTANGGTYFYDQSVEAPGISGVAVFNYGATYYGQPGVSAGQAYFSTFEDARSIQAKVNYLFSNGFGGIMMYDLSADLNTSASFGSRNLLHYAAITSIAALLQPDRVYAVKRTSGLTYKWLRYSITGINDLLSQV